MTFETLVVKILILIIGLPAMILAIAGIFACFVVLIRLVSGVDICEDETLALEKTKRHDE